MCDDLALVRNLRDDAVERTRLGHVGTEAGEGRQPAGGLEHLGPSREWRGRASGARITYNNGGRSTA